MTLTDQFLEVATALSNVSDLLDDLKGKLPPVARAHLGLGISSVLNARRQLDLVVRATDPEHAPMPALPMEPPHRD